MIPLFHRRFVDGTLAVQLAHLREQIILQDGAPILTPRKQGCKPYQAVTRDQRDRILERSERRYLMSAERLSREISLPEVVIKRVRAAFESESAVARRAA